MLGDFCGSRRRYALLDTESVDGGRRWTRTSGLLHVKRFRLSAVLGASVAEQNGRSYTVTG